MVFVTCAIGFGAYRFEIVEHSVPVRIVGPDGRQYRQISRACSRFYKDQPDHKKGTRFVSAFVWSLNAAYRKHPDAAERFTVSVSECRAVQDAFVAAENILSEEAGERDGSFWLLPKSGTYTRVSDALIANGMVTAALTDEVFGGQDPSKVDKRLSRVGAAKGPSRKRNGAFRSDVDRRLRLKGDRDAAPRYDDPRFYDRLEAGLTAVGTSAGIMRMTGLARYSGARFCQAAALTVHDVLVMPKRGKVGKHIPSPNKGSKDDREMTLIPPPSEMGRLFDYIAGTRAELSGMSLEELKLMAADPRRRDELRSMPLFTEDGVNPIKYARLYYVFHKAAVKAGLWIDGDEFRETGRKRYVSFHYLRHEYVHGRLDEVMLMPNELMQLNGRKAIKAYMKWKSDEMLDWYSAHHTMKLAFAGADEHNAKVDAGLHSSANAPMDSMFSSGSAVVDDMMAGLA